MKEMALTCLSLFGLNEAIDSQTKVFCFDHYRMIRVIKIVAKAI